MVETFEIVLQVEHAPDRWVTAARWANGPDGMQAARWAAAQIGGRVLCVHTKGWVV